MSQRLITVAPDTTIADALALSREHRVRHLPVLREKRLVGIVTDRDIRLAIPPIWGGEHDALQQALHERTVADVMTANPITAPANLPIEDAAKLLYSNKIGCLPVMEGDVPVGIITERDVLQAFVELFGVAHESTRMEVKMVNRPGELSRVVRLIGIDYRVNITGMVVPPASRADTSTAIIHIQTNDPQPVIEGLRRMGYTIGWPALDIRTFEPLTPDEQQMAPTRGVMYGGGAEL